MTVLFPEIFKKQSRRKKLAVLIDPEKTTYLGEILNAAENFPPDIFLVGGSSPGNKNLDRLISSIKKRSNIPVLIFPGNPEQISEHADGLLLLSVISGRNPDLLIGQHVKAAMHLKKTAIKIFPTGYILIESGRETSVNKFSSTKPISRKDNALAVSTAVAGEQLGMKFIYLEAGSGARNSVPEKMITAVKKNISIPLIVGGGIRSAPEMKKKFAVGADIVVIGNHLENFPESLSEFVKAVPK
ncbi:MAG: geranylgeranylglyceryl/heptaprenylglyceryl phosphate synthase [Bacteroidetes bacterium]|nr:geranylgeranylglyceryl/heptaprenylglyceryl phosphate synthase [Bacteroidota bacterium]